jgi:hypothetical protein
MSTNTEPTMCCVDNAITFSYGFSSFCSGLSVDLWITRTSFKNKQQVGDLEMAAAALAEEFYLLACDNCVPCQM